MALSLGVSGLALPAAAQFGSGPGPSTPMAPGMSAPSSASPGVSTVSGNIIEPVKNYRLGPQDVLRISVERPQQYSVPEVVIPPDGKISLPYFGTFRVSGMTQEALEAALTRSISKRVRFPKVTVGLIRLRNAASGYVSILGAVKMPGQIEILPNYRITEVLSKVGGPSGRPDEARASLARNGKQIPIDIYQAISYPREKKYNVQVQNGDFIYVENVDPGQVSINGDLSKTGVYEFRRAPRPGYNEIPTNARLLNVITAAGGIMGLGEANAGKVTGTLKRRNQSTLIDLRVQDAIQFKDASANIPLQPGDYISIKVQPPIMVGVSGFVNTQGNVRLPPDATVLQAINEAKGLSRDFEEINASLQRGDQRIPIDLNRLYKGDISANLALQNGDFINLAEPNNIRVEISGKVATPSGGEPFRLPPDSTLLDALARASSITVKPQNVRISILRRDDNGKQIPLNIDTFELFERNNPGQNPRLNDGDLITVSEVRDKTVIITGRVQRPGAYDWREGQGIAEILAKAGGPTTDALLSGISILREGKRIQVDAYDEVNGRPSTFPLQENDTITIPENLNRIIVTEAVNRPGIVYLPERRTMTVLEAMSAAGGAVRGARTQEVALLRQDAKAPGGVRTMILPLNKMDKGINIGAAQMPVQAGDIIVVPEGKVKQSAIGTALGLISLVNVARSFTGN